MRRVTLTFDNGPHEGVTPAVLDSLARHGVRGTFFVQGRNLNSPAARELVLRARREGHWIGNHTFSHRRLGGVDPRLAVEEIERAEKALAFFDPPVRLFRPVGGGELGPHLLQPAAVEKLVRDGYTCVLWNSVPGDWRDPDGWLVRGLADCQARDWSLVVLHDQPNGALPHLDTFLTALEAGDFEFTQEFPPDCVPIREGHAVLPLEPYLTAPVFWNNR